MLINFESLRITRGADRHSISPVPYLRCGASETSPYMPKLNLATFLKVRKGQQRKWKRVFIRGLVNYVSQNSSQDLIATLSTAVRGLPQLNPGGFFGRSPSSTHFFYSPSLTLFDLNGPRRRLAPVASPVNGATKKPGFVWLGTSIHILASDSHSRT